MQLKFNHIIRHSSINKAVLRIQSPLCLHNHFLPHNIEHNMNNVNLVNEVHKCKYPAPNRHVFRHILHYLRISFEKTLDFNVGNSTLLISCKGMLSLFLAVKGKYKNLSVMQGVLEQMEM